MSNLQQLVENGAIRRFKRVCASDFNQLSCLGKSIQIGDLLNGQTHDLICNATRPIWQVVSCITEPHATFGGARLVASPSTGEPVSANTKCQPARLVAIENFRSLQIPLANSSEETHQTSAAPLVAIPRPFSRNETPTWSPITARLVAFHQIK